MAPGASPPGFPRSGYLELTSLSCATTTFCVAINSGVAFTYNGYHWSQAADVDPHIYGLNSVSCPTTTFCAAVGGSAGSYTGVEVTYNGSTWTTPVQITPYRYLTAVSCPTAGFCAAVGGDFSNEIGTAVTFNGASWSPMTSVDPSPQLASIPRPHGSLLRRRRQTRKRAPRPIPDLTHSVSSVGYSPERLGRGVSAAPNESVARDLPGGYSSGANGLPGSPGTTPTMPY